MLGGSGHCAAGCCGAGCGAAEGAGRTVTEVGADVDRSGAAACCLGGALGRAFALDLGSGSTAARCAGGVRFCCYIKRPPGKHQLQNRTWFGIQAHET